VLSLKAPVFFHYVFVLFYRLFQQTVDDLSGFAGSFVELRKINEAPKIAIISGACFVYAFVLRRGKAT